MHAVGLHSALAIKRQRKRRDEQRRARERRYSSQSGESGLTSPRASTVSLNQHLQFQRKMNKKKKSVQGIADSKVVTSIGMLHIGIVFLVSGLFLLISGLLPNEFTSSKNKSSKTWWNELTGVGLFLLMVGCFFTLLNTMIAKREENELEQYVHRQLTRSKSGHRLERDAKTGGLTTKQAKRVKKKEQTEYLYDSTHESEINIKSPLRKESLPFHSSLLGQDNNLTTQSNTLLEKITEEELANEKLGSSYTIEPNYISSIQSEPPQTDISLFNSSCKIQLHNNHLCEMTRI